MKSITTQDNPWSSADIYYYIACPTCSARWRIEHGHLVNRESEEAYRSSKANQDACRAKLWKLVNQLADEYFSDFGAPTKKAEHDEMVRLGISNISYNAFLKGKRQGDPSSTLCFPLRNVSWLRELARASAGEGAFETLYAAYKNAERQTQAAYGQIIRRKMPQ